jgi:tetratricopeptide (TPR) repeat protein
MSYQACPVVEVSTNTCLLVSASANYKSRNYQDAIVEYSKAIQLDPTDAQAFCGRGVAYYRLSDGHRALKDYNRAIELDPNLSIAYYRRGFLHYLTKDYSSAIVDYNKAIELKPDFALAYSNRGYVYRDLYGEQEASLDWRFAAKLFKEQGNLEKYTSMMLLIEKACGADSCASGMLW